MSALKLIKRIKCYFGKHEWLYWYWHQVFGLIEKEQYGWTDMGKKYCNNCKASGPILRKRPIK